MRMKNKPQKLAIKIFRECSKKKKKKILVMTRYDNGLANVN